MISEKEQKILDNAPDGAEYYYRDPNTDKYHYSEFAGQARLETLRKKQGKTVWGAVNYFKGIWPHTDSALLMYTHCWNFDNHQLPDGYLVCTMKSFNQCVKEMAEARWMSQSGDFYCYESYKEDYEEPLKETKMSEEKQVYTQAMKNAGELPSVGMRCKVKNEWLFVGVNSRGSWVLEKPEHFDAYQAFNPKDVKPIDTLTPEQRQIDTLAEFAFQNSKMTHEELFTEMQRMKWLAEIK